ncbi:MAG: DUF805 domain-containing protein [Sodaliphilus sp.]
MTLGDSINTCLNKYATIRGRASRSEFWWFVVFYWIAQLVTVGVFYLIGMLVGGGGGGIIAGSIGNGLVILALICPYFCVLVRRLHDGGHSGAWFFSIFVPFVGLIGALIVLVFLLQGSDDENKYGLPEY